MAITAWSANVVTSPICLSVYGSTRCRASATTPNQFARAQQRNAEQGPEIADFGMILVKIFRVFLHVQYYGGAASERCAADERVAPDLVFAILLDVEIFRTESVARRPAQAVSMHPKDLGYVRIAQARRRLDERVE